MINFCKVLPVVSTGKDLCHGDVCVRFFHSSVTVCACGNLICKHRIIVVRVGKFSLVFGI